LHPEERTMSDRRRRLRPELELLEPLALLAAGPAALAGTVHGTFFAHKSNAASGVVYNLFASGRVAPVGPTLVAGGFQTRGFSAGGAGGGNMVFAPLARPGNVFLRLTELSGPTAAAPGQYEFSYAVTRGPEAGMAARQSGTLEVTLEPITTNLQGKPVANPRFFGNATLSFS
jgi:hypothetical protein